MNHKMMRCSVWESTLMKKISANSLRQTQKKSKRVNKWEESQSFSYSNKNYGDERRKKTRWKCANFSYVDGIFFMMITWQRSLLWRLKIHLRIKMKMIYIYKQTQCRDFIFMDFVTRDKKKSYVDEKANQVILRSYWEVGNVIMRQTVNATVHISLAAATTMCLSSFLVSAECCQKCN